MFRTDQISSERYVYFVFLCPYGDTCTLSGTMVQSVHVTYDKWGVMPPCPLNCFQVIRGVFGKFLAWSYISVTNLQTLSCVVSF